MNGLVAVVSLLVAGGSDWMTHTPKGAGFSITMPGVTTETFQTAKAALGTLAIRLLTSTTKDGTYVAGLTEYPESAVVAGQDQHRLDQARDGAVQKVKGRLRWEKNLSIDGRAAREFFVATETGHAIKVRLIADRHRLYQLMVVGNTRFLDSREASRFLDSFRVTK